MNWAARRKLLYSLGVFFFFAAIFSVPAAMWYYDPPTCFDGIQNQRETAIDRSGPCKLLDARRLIPHSVLWTRQFYARPGVHTAVAYIENPNQEAGVKEAPYRMKLYDEKNVLVAEREGITPVMPGTITAVFVSDLESGERMADRAFFEFVAPLVWERLYDRSENIAVSDKLLEDIDTTPKISAKVVNEDVDDFMNVALVAVVFDTAGNAFAASRTIIPLLQTRKTYDIAFTWSKPFTKRVARIDILPVIPPKD